ncbi:MAG TPA: hydantoinase/oxoprolinase family protein [Gammaproteobacteria bacterium]|nr:hydantoinase/oxoprolinase family protein [Gammaproteobacteria bacterium]
MNDRTLLGVDTGGTFTDFVLWDGRALRIHKVLSTPAAPEQAILQGIMELGLDPAGLAVIHGSTVATNAVLEGKGVRTVFITNHGLRDLLTLGRQARRELYALQPAPLPPPVPAALCLETGGRLGADGEVVDPLDEAALSRLRAQVEALAPRAVAINLLFSFLDDRFERAIEAALPADLFISRSSEVLPEYKEYERGVATWLNAWVGPLVEAYLKRLTAGLAGSRLAVMQSSGGTLEAGSAARQAVRMLLSGPAGGLQGARHVGAAAGRSRLLTFDMGGTSTDVALIDGEPRLTSEGRIGPYPVAVPMVDMHTIGAGGGSIATVDAAGMLQVGPSSAGADPGPACYGRGGTRPTVTDANLVLGRLLPHAFLGGRMRLDAAAARRALATLAAPLGMDVEGAAEGVIRLANEHMAHALRVISVQRGHDPRDFTLVSFGGAGGLHVCALAEALDMETAMVPVHGGVLSALGMLAARRERQLSRTCAGPLKSFPPAELEARFVALEEEGRAALAREGVPMTAIGSRRSVDLRYAGQSFTLNVPWTGLDDTLAAFHLAHEQRYGHRLDLPVELVNLRTALHGPRPELPLPPCPPAALPSPMEYTSMWGQRQPVPVWSRNRLGAGCTLPGPALITEEVATTYIAPGWTCRVDGVGNLLLDKAL